MPRWPNPVSENDGGSDIDSEYAGREPVISFPTDALLTVFQDQIHHYSGSDDYLFRVERGTKGPASMNVLSKVQDFLTDGINGGEKYAQWEKSYFFNELGVRDENKWDDFSRASSIFVSNGVVKKSLYETFPDNEIRRYFLGSMILGYQLLFGEEYLKDNEEKAKQLESEGKKYGGLLSIPPLPMMLGFRNICERYSKIYSENKNLDIESIKIEGLSDIEAKVYALRKGLLNNQPLTLRMIRNVIDASKEQIIEADKSSQEKMNSKKLKSFLSQKFNVRLSKKEFLLFGFFVGRFLPYGQMDVKGKDTLKRSGMKKTPKEIFFKDEENE